MSGVAKHLQLWHPSRSYIGLGKVLSRPLPSRMSFLRHVQNPDCEVGGSHVPAASAETESQKLERSSLKEKPGAFQKLPMVMPSNDIFLSALRKSKRVSPTKGIANIAKRERNRGAKQLDALMKELIIPLRTYMESFPFKESLHPYERSLIELTLGEGRYEEVLRRLDSLRKKINSVGKSQASLCAKSTSKREAVERLNEGIKQLEGIFLHEGIAVDDLLNIAKEGFHVVRHDLIPAALERLVQAPPKTLRAMPVVDPETPTLCLVGAPNVGKSSLVRVLSSGKPEVCNYPFTTRGILMGHILLNYERFQVTDTPGLLRRPNEDRNNIEKLTLAVLSHLPTAILYVHDLSGECGSSPDDQFVTYKEIRTRFQDQLWLDVVSKCDLPRAHSYSDGTDCDAVAKYKRWGPDDAIHVSVISETGVPELKRRVHDLLVHQLVKIRGGSDVEE